MKTAQTPDDIQHNGCIIRIKEFPNRGYSWRVTGGDRKYLCAWCRFAFYETRWEALDAAILWIDKGKKPKYVPR